MPLMRSRRNKNPAPVRCILCFCYVSLSLVWLLLHWTYMQSIQNWSVNPTVPPGMLVFFLSVPQWEQGHQCRPLFISKRTSFSLVTLKCHQTRLDRFSSVLRVCRRSTSSGRLLDILTDSEELQTWTSQINRLCTVEWGSQDQVVFTCAFILQVGTIFLTFWQIKQLSIGSGVQ